MWITATYVLLMMACTGHGAACSPPDVMKGFVTEAACREAARSVAPLLKAANPELAVAHAACPRGLEEKDREAAHEHRSAG